MNVKETRYDRKNNEWDAYLDGEYIGTYRSSHAAENELNRLVFERNRRAENVAKLEELAA